MFDIFSPYTDTIIYPDCIGSGRKNSWKSTELLNYLTIYQHLLHIGIIYFILDLGKSTFYRIFVGWAVLIETLFSKLNLNQMKAIYQKRG